MATVSSISPYTLPVAGADMDAEPITTQFNNILSFLNEASNFDEANCDLTSTNGLVGKSTAQTVTGTKSWENTQDAAGGVRDVAKFGIDPGSGTAADNDGGRLTFYADDDGGTATDVARMDWVLTDASNTTEDARVDWSVITAGTLASELQLSGASLNPTTDAGLTLGTASLRFGTVYADTLGDSAQALGVAATTFSFDAASTIDTSGNNNLTIDVGSGVLALDAATLDSDATTLSFDAAATIDTSGNNNLTLSAGTASLVVTAGDVTVYDDNNGADVSLTMGTGSAESFSITVDNGGSNKTAEEIKLTSKTASGTTNHGKIGFYVDEVKIGTFDDGGLDLESGMVFSVNGSTIASATIDSIANGADNRIVTFSDSDSLNGEANLEFDGSTLSVTGSIDMVAHNNRIDLDANNDTSIRASADDTIMFELNGADDFSMTANSLNILSGSVIDLADNAPVQFGDADDASIKWDTSDLAISAGTAAVNITAGDLTLYDDTNGADVSLKMGTAAAESFSITVDNGGSNKTAEKVILATATASGTGDAGQFEFSVDGSTVVNIDDGGLSLNGAKAIDTGGNHNLTLNAGTADVVVTASDLDVNGNIDISGNITADNQYLLGGYDAYVDGTNGNYQTIQAADNTLDDETGYTLFVNGGQTYSETVEVGTDDNYIVFGPKTTITSLVISGARNHVIAMPGFNCTGALTLSGANSVMEIQGAANLDNAVLLSGAGSKLEVGPSSDFAASATLTLQGDDSGFVAGNNTSHSGAVLISGSSCQAQFGSSCDLGTTLTVSGNENTVTLKNGCDIDGIVVSGNDNLVDGGGWGTVSRRGGSTGSADAILVTGTRNLVRNIAGQGTSSSARSLRTNTGTLNTFENCYAVTPTSGAPGVNLDGDENAFVGCYLNGGGSGQRAIEVGGHRCRVIGCYVVAGGGGGIYVNTDNVLVSGNHVEGGEITFTSNTDNGIVDSNICDAAVSDSGTGNTIGDNEVY